MNPKIASVTTEPVSKVLEKPFLIINAKSTLTKFVSGRDTNFWFPICATTPSLIARLDWLNLYNSAMAIPILATKLYKPPARANLVSRPRLINRLSEGLYRKLSLISAPAGFGKSTLISEWLANTERPAAWLSLEEGDSDPTRFLSYVVAALQTLGPTLGEGIFASLELPQPPESEALLTMLLNDINAESKDCLFVLDDYHLIDSHEVDDMLSFLIEHLPPQTHLIIMTREDPQLPLPRLRVRDELTELRAADLRFTPDEISQFLNQGMGLNLSAKDISQLETRTEGWIAGLQMAALSMKGHADSAHFIQAFTGNHHYILDYLIEEVLQQQSETVQTFLLQTSILKRLTGALCEAVTGQDDNKEILKTLERGNLFIIPLDDQREWYRYHHLFADVLQARLRKAHADDVADLHLRASEWYEQQDLLTEAIRHAFAAKNLERAADLAERAFPEMDSRLQTATWLMWIEALPDELIHLRPVLSVEVAQALLYRGEIEASEIRLQDAERWLEQNAEISNLEGSWPEMGVLDEEKLRALPATIANTRAFQAQALGDLPRTVKYVRQALKLLPEEDLLGRGTAAAVLGLALWTSGDLEEAYPTIVDAMNTFQKLGNLLVAISGTKSMADIQVTLGRLGEAVRTYERALQLVAEQGDPVLLGTADLYLGLSEMHREQGNFIAAQRHLLKSEALGEQAGSIYWQYRLRLAQARITQVQGDLHSALDLLDEAERLYVHDPAPDVCPIAALKTQVWIKQGKLDQAFAWVSEQGLSVNDELSYVREFEYITLARLLIAHYKTKQLDEAIHDAFQLLARLLEAAKEGKRTRSVIEILVVQALAHHAQGDTPEALESLLHAMTLAEPEGYVRTFVDEGLPMKQLLAAEAKNILPDYVAKLHAAFHTSTQVSQATSAKTAAEQMMEDLLLESLTPRELEVLQLLAEGLSNRKISERLFRALDTVKGYNRKIFSKLQVGDRHEAVARARELGLLDSTT